ncbi:MAG: hypothetical protein P9L92_13075 [Candidatus Electryonea clarkiae]|nr:hypothetical protein [Candidatus Electryonea clarkiae]MDP8286444.1 hypothetical protein [Candidatus Electryonea clarkiae]
MKSLINLSIGILILMIGFFPLILPGCSSDDASDGSADVPDEMLGTWDYLALIYVSEHAVETNPSGTTFTFDLNGDWEIRVESTLYFGGTSSWTGSDESATGTMKFTDAPYDPSLIGEEYSATATYSSEIIHLILLNANAHYVLASPPEDIGAIAGFTENVDNDYFGGVSVTITPTEGGDSIPVISNEYGFFFVGDITEGVYILDAISEDMTWNEQVTVSIGETAVIEAKLE